MACASPAIYKNTKLQVFLFQHPKPAMFLPKFVLFAIWLTIRESLGNPRDCECGVGNEEEINFRIINGQELAPHKYPWMVYLNYSGKMYCGGAIINNRYILTAGHCVYNLQKNRMLVYVGAHDLDKDKGIPMRVDSYKIHPQYTRYRDYDDNDLALIRLTDEIVYNKNINPICLPIRGNYKKDQASIAGWGITETQKVSNTLLFSSVRILPDDVCIKSSEIGKKFKIGENICAYGFKTDTCQGDSGSPLMHEVRTYKYQVLGVVSWGHGCAPMGIPGVYANIVHYVPWILESTRDAQYCSR